MKNTHHIIIAALALSLLAACGTTATVAGAKAYPLKTCIVTDNDLQSMGDEQTIIHEGQVVKFCCEPCVAKFKENPAKYLAKLR